MEVPGPDKNTTEIVRKCLKGDAKSQEKLYKLFYGYGMSVCFRYSVNEEEAIEVYNDAFMKVFKNLERFDQTKSFKSWFRRILINTAINHIKSKINRKHIHDDLTINNVQYDVSPSDDLDYEELLKLIQLLTPAYRSVFNLYVIDGYNHDEIAKMLDISVGASKSNLSRARAKLREMIVTINKGEYERVG